MNSLREESCIPAHSLRAAQSCLPASMSDRQAELIGLHPDGRLAPLEVLRHLDHGRFGAGMLTERLQLLIRPHLVAALLTFFCHFRIPFVNRCAAYGMSPSLLQPPATQPRKQKTQKTPTKKNKTRNTKATTTSVID